MSFWAATSCLSPLCLSSSPSLDDIRGKLSQFDLYYYNYKFERSIRELRSNVMDYPNKTTANSRCIDNNLRQVCACSLHLWILVHLLASGVMIYYFDSATK